MPGHSKLLLEEGYLRLKFDELITSLRTAVEKGDGVLDKEATSYEYIFDAFRLSLRLSKVLFQIMTSFRTIHAEL
jgi:hypothetical protein